LHPPHRRLVDGVQKTRPSVVVVGDVLHAHAVTAVVNVVAPTVVGKSSGHHTMRTWFKYGLAFLAVCLVLAFFSRERFTMYPASEEPERPEKLLVPYGNVLYTEGGD